MGEYQARNHRQLYRSRDDAVLGGVLGGFADYFDVPSWGLRLGAVILQFTFAPWLFIAYLVMCCVLKKEPGAYDYEDRSREERWEERQERRRARAERRHERHEYMRQRRRDRHAGRAGEDSYFEEQGRRYARPDAAAEIKREFENLEQRLQKMESAVIKPGFEFEDEFRKL